jgi:hypothetical protein
MLTAKQKIEKLQEAIALLQDVDALQQVGMEGFDSDVCYELHNEIENIIDTLGEAIGELEVENA